MGQDDKGGMLSGFGFYSINLKGNPMQIVLVLALSMRFVSYKTPCVNSFGFCSFAG